MDEKLMGNLLMEATSDKKYGVLKRLLMNSITQGQNSYPNSKAASYTMLCNYVPKFTKEKNE